MIHNIRHMPHVIPIGIQTETGVEPIGFDVKPWLDEYDGLTITVWPTRPGEGAAYPAADVKLVGTVLYWTPNATDTAIQGVGRVEILGVADGKRKLSGYCDTLVKGTSLDATQETPEPIKPWVDQVVAAGAQALTAVDKMPKISAGGTWMVWDAAAGEYVDSGTSAKGKDGQDGYTPIKGKDYIDGKDGHDGISPVVKLTETADGVDISVADVEGEKTATVRHGKDGRDGKDGLDGKDGRDGIDGQDGDTRVYVGSDEPPEDAEVWIDPEGAVAGSDLPAATETEPGAVILDTSLTKSGAAADAKTVGDKFTALTEEIAKLPQGGGGAAIVDVAALPETDIREDVFYRLSPCTFYIENKPSENFKCLYVDGLPQEGEPVTTDMVHVVMYYSVDTGSVSGYITSALSGTLGVPAGWYPIETLAQMFRMTWGGIVNSLEEMMEAPGAYYLLVTQGGVKYRDKDAWNHLSVQPDWSVNDESDQAFVKNRTHYEKPVVREIEWDGDMTGRFAMDLAALGMDGMYLVKVSDRVYTQDELLERQVVTCDGSVYELELNYAEELLPGVRGMPDYVFVVIHDADALSAAMNVSHGIIQNGTYMLAAPGVGYYTHALETLYGIVKLDEKYLPDNVVRIIDADIRLPACTLDGGIVTEAIQEGTWLNSNINKIDGQTIRAACYIDFGSSKNTLNFNFVVGQGAVKVSEVFVGYTYMQETTIARMYVVINANNRTISVMAKTLTI